MHPYRTHTCNELRASDAGKTVRLSGWMFRLRDHGGILFVDLRDHYGLTQIVVHPSRSFFGLVEKAHLESVITVTGEVKLRTPDTINPELPTGEIEIEANELVMESASQVTPLYIPDEKADESEDVRLQYRFLDLRREKLHKNIILRSEVIRFLREQMWEKGFHEFQTPILTASSPEGARDYLVPSRIHRGMFYAGAADVQAAPDGLGLRQVFLDRAVLPRRGSARRPQPWRVLPDGYRDVLRDAGRDFRRR